MTEPTRPAVPRGLADLPLEVRRAQEVERDRDIRDGLTRRHLAVAADERAHVAGNLARAIALAPEVADLLRGD